MDHGKIIYENLKKSKLGINDFLQIARENGFYDITQINCSILETSGKLSVFRKDDDKNRVYPLPIIIDGKIQKDVLYQIGKDSIWLEKALRHENYQLEDVFYGFYQKNKLFLIRKEAVK